MTPRHQRQHASSTKGRGGLTRHHVKALLVISLLALAGWFALYAVDTFVMPVRTLIYPCFRDIGFSIEMDAPDYCQFILTNDADEAAHDVTLTIQEDWSYIGKGQRKRTIQIGDMKPHEQRTFSYVYYLPGIESELGQLELWLKCDRGKAFDCTRWSWAY